MLFKHIQYTITYTISIIIFIIDNIFNQSLESVLIQIHFQRFYRFDIKYILILFLHVLE